MSDALSRMAAVAPGKRFVVELPTARKEVETAPPTMADVALGILQRDALRDREMIAELGRSVESLRESFALLKEAVDGLSSAQTEISKSIAGLAETMAKPVRPIYDAKGKLIGAERA